VQEETLPGCMATDKSAANGLPNKRPVLGAATPAKARISKHAKNALRRQHYWCPRCEVFRRGTTCWYCGAEELEWAEGSWLDSGLDTASTPGRRSDQRR
jgi:hypothetical protein